jgi:hypothetical protein
MNWIFLWYSTVFGVGAFIGATYEHHTGWGLAIFMGINCFCAVMEKLYSKPNEVHLHVSTPVVHQEQPPAQRRGRGPK